MKISTRKEAFEALETQYFTGRPCKHGHIDYRYTASGGCSRCIRDAGRGFRNPVVPDLTRSEARSQLADLAVRAYHDDYPLLRDTAAALAKARAPSLSDEDARPPFKCVKQAGGTAVYTVRCNVGDIEPMRAMADALLNARKVDIAAARAQILGDVLAIKNPL